MSSESRLTVPRGAAVLAAAGLLMTGAGASYLLMRTSHVDREEMAGQRSGAAAQALSPAAPRLEASVLESSNERLPDVVVPLTSEAIERAGIVVAPVAAASTSGDFRLPGVVEPNAYRLVTVTPLVSGRVTQVAAALGDHVRRGQPMAQIYSPELAEAQTRYVSARAMLEAHDRELQRTQKLVNIGAASRQELERIHAEHAAQTAAVQSARSELDLLGVAPSMLDALAAGEKVNATITVQAPTEGAVTERAANAGLNVEPATKLFTVVDLSTVWVVADLYERDFSRIRVGSEAAVRTTAYPDLAVRGRISYIDPQVNQETRTAKVRVEVPNPRGELRLGMYADVVIREASSGQTTVVPRSAVQNVGSRTVVYLANSSDPGKFLEREVRLGQTSEGQIEVVSGVQPGDAVVTNGSFFIRAERERLGLRPRAGMAGRDPSTATVGTPGAAPASVQTAKVVLDERGFQPASVSLRAGTAVRMTFVRTTDNTCGTEVVFPTLNVKRALPLNTPVDIEFTPTSAGDVSFACGMNMFRGVVIVQ
jgi:RND family efflux transporter MFP subunit